MYWLVVAAVVLLCWCARPRPAGLLAHLPTYPTLPLLGHMHKFIGDGQNAFRYLKEISEIIEETKLPFVLWIGHHCFIMLSDPEDARLVANTFLEKPHFYDFAKMWLRDGLLTAPGSVWKRNVKAIASAFNSSAVDGFLSIFNEQAHKLVMNLKKESNCAPFDLLHKHLAHTTLEAICQTALGECDVTQSLVTKEYYEAFNRTLELMFQRSLNIFLHPEAVYRLTPAYREMKACVQVLHNLSQSILSKRRKEKRLMKTKEITDKDKSKQKCKCFLDMLLEMSESDSAPADERIKAEVDTIILAGQETVATALNFIFLMLGCKQDVQQKLCEEIKEVFGGRKNVMKEDLMRLRYCEAVICETLRLLPPVPGVLRRAHTDLRLKSCTIPEGATCCINIWGAGRSRALWGDKATLYQPERWLSTLPSNLPSILNFSTGKRACIGRHYAMCLMKTIIVHCMRELEFKSQAENMTLKIDIALRPVRGHLIQVREKISRE